MTHNVALLQDFGATQYKCSAALSRLIALPRIAQSAGAGVGLRAGGEFAVELGQQGPLRGEESCAPADVSAELCGIGAPLTVKVPPGSDSNAALSAGL